MLRNETAAVAVVGAGMVGVCCALELQRRGLMVRLFDRKGPGQETSYGNAGVFARSSLIPLNNPGLWATLPRLLRNRSPQLRYNPLYMLRQTMWGLGFVSRARTAAFNETATALDSLIRLSMPVHRRLMQEAGIEHRLRDNGWIFLYRSAEAFAGSRFARDVYDRFEIATQELDPSALRALEPHLQPIFPRALWIKDTCSVDDPGRVVEAYAALFQARGGELVRQEIAAVHPAAQDLWQLRGRDGRATTAHKVVIALGPWANDLLKPLGVAAPLAFERGYHRHFAPASGASLGRPVYDTAAGYVLAPVRAGLRLSTGVELTERDAPANRTQLELAEVALRQAFPIGPRSGPDWLGSRPTLPDCRPLIGEAPRHPGLWLAIGHQHIGLSTGPGTAQVLACLMLGEECSIDPRPFRAERFIA